MLSSFLFLEENQLATGIADMCREAHETRAEIAELMAQGQDVAELETAVIELINELDNCSLDMTPSP